MGGAYYILIINVALGVLLLGGFVALWLLDPKGSAARFCALATACFLVGGGLELLAPYLGRGDAALLRLAIQLTNLVACTLLALGVLRQYQVGFRPAHAWLFLVASVVLIALLIDLPRQSPLRMAANQLPLALAIGFATACALRSGRCASALDRLFALSLALFAANMMLRPVLLAHYGTMGADPASYHLTQYAVLTQFAMAITTMTCATLGLMVLVSGMMRDLSDRSLRDPLTGLMNRRGLVGTDSGWGTDGGRGTDGGSGAVVVADIDRFKSINDRHGHAVGDEVIVDFARTLSAAARDGDTVARIGGEEFVMLARRTTPAMARLMAEGARTAFAAHRHGDVGRVTASFGIAAWTAGEPIDDAIARADAALYEAKRAGRNRTVVTPPPERRAARPAAGARAAG